MRPGWPVVLSHGSVGVRPVRRRDAATWTRLRRTDQTWFGPWDATLPPEGGPPATSSRAVIGALLHRARRGTSMPFATTWDGEMVGMVTVSNIVWGSARWASIGYWVDSAYAGRNITPTAVALVCDHLFGTTGLHRVEIAVRPENVASLRVVEKLGLTEIGLAPRYLHIAGDWRDHRVFQLLAEDARDGVLSRVVARS